MRALASLAQTLRKIIPAPATETAVAGHTRPGPGSTPLLLGLSFWLLLVGMLGGSPASGPRRRSSSSAHSHWGS
jgi:hypothetical protein